MTRWTAVLAIGGLLGCPIAAGASPLVLELSPDRTSLTFTVKATGHTIEGLLALDSGEIRFDPDTGAASGQATIDLRRTGTGNRPRDREMHASVLETERYPVATFRPNRVVGALAPWGPSVLALEGLLGLHGSEHPVTLPVKASLTGEVVVGAAQFRASCEALSKMHPGLFGQMLVTRLFRQEDILTQICGNDFRVLKVAPPLVASVAQMDQFVDAVARVVEDMHSSLRFWTDTLALVGRLSRI